jgi:hypothetical protein
MPPGKLTDVTIKSLRPPESGQKTYWDDAVPGFGVRVSQGGSKAFVLVHGVNRERVTIGRYPIISLSDARGKAKERLRRRPALHNPSTRHRLGHCAKGFLKRHLTICSTY